jgi:hypothetical protein
MEQGFGQCDDGQLLATMNACLDALTDDRLRLPTDAEQLGLLQDVVRLGGRLQGFEQQLAARTDAEFARAATMMLKRGYA